MPTLRSCLLVSDLHLNANVRDAYRWEIWKDLARLAKNYKVADVFILGDLTTEKDFHSAHVVNGVVRGIMSLGAVGADVHILRGNHDGIDPNEPYFGFLSEFESVNFYTKPTRVWSRDANNRAVILMYPHSERLEMSEKDWPSGKCDFVFAHMTVSGALSESGRLLRGFDIRDVERFFGGLPIFSGDDHRPQMIGTVEYIGAPYHVRFGDKFQGRIVLFDRDGNRHDLPTTYPNKHMVTASDFAEAQAALASVLEGDQVKIVMKINPADLPDWHAMKTALANQAERRGVDLCGIDLSVDMGMSAPELLHYPSDDPRAIPWLAVQALERYAEQKGLTPDQARLGRELYTEAES